MALVARKRVLVLSCEVHGMSVGRSTKRLELNLCNQGARCDASGIGRVHAAWSIDLLSAAIYAQLARKPRSDGCARDAACRRLNKTAVRSAVS
jgi:hypothetical protein